MIDDKHRRIGVYGWCIGEWGVLLAQVSPAYSSSMPWTLPGGGMEWGETPRETLVREFKEETGLLPRIDEPLYVRSRVIDVEAVGRPVHNLQIVFAVEAGGEPRPEERGSTVDARWVPVDEVEDLVLVSLVRESLERWRE